MRVRRASVHQDQTRLVRVAPPQIADRATGHFDEMLGRGDRDRLGEPLWRGGGHAEACSMRPSRASAFRDPKTYPKYHLKWDTGLLRVSRALAELRAARTLTPEKIR